MSGVVDRASCRRRQRLGQLLVLGGERSAGAPGQVQVAEHLVANPDRHAQEAVHRRMPRREPAERSSSPSRSSRIGARIVDQRPEQTLPLRQVPDPGDVLIGHADVDELGQMPVGGDHPERGVPSADSSRAASTIRRSTTGRARSEPIIWLARNSPRNRPWGVDHLLGSRHQLLEQLIQGQSRHIRETQRTILA